MSDSIAIGVSGMKAMQQVVETLSANVANVNTPSYKRVEPQMKTIGFSSWLPAEGDENASAQNISVSSGVRFTAPRRSMTEGQLKKTDRALDLAIRGNGFFPLNRPDGVVVYTRNGDFRADAEGFLVDANGYRLASDIQIPTDAKNIRIASDGRVYGTITDKEENLGQIELASFGAPEQLAYENGGIYRPTDASGEAEISPIADGKGGTIAQGYLETSNVKIVDEFVSLVVAQRAYEANAKMVQAMDEMSSLANGLLKG